MSKRLAWKVAAALVLCMAFIGGYLWGQSTTPRVRWMTGEGEALCGPYQAIKPPGGVTFFTDAQEPMRVELGFREDGVVVWRRIIR